LKTVVLGRNAKPGSKSSLHDPSTKADEHPVFSYDLKDKYNPYNWYLINPNCAGSKQSPVHLQESSAVVVNNPLKIDGFDKVPTAIKVINNGHGAGMEFQFNEGAVLFSGGPLKNPYILKNVHWHWGEADFGGSEHALNRMRFDSEVHFVTYNSIYGESLSVT
jgi:carbonic anhydrase